MKNKYMSVRGAAKRQRSNPIIIEECLEIGEIAAPPKNTPPSSGQAQGGSQ